MFNKFSILLLSTLLFSQIVNAENTNNWLSVANDDTTYYLAKKGTFKITKDESSILMMFDNKSTKTIEYFKVSIKNADCDNGFGKLYFFGLDGVLAFKGDYVADGNSIGAGMGDFICGARQSAQRG